MLGVHVVPVQPETRTYPSPQHPGRLTAPLARTQEPPEVGSSRPELRTRALPPSPVSTPGLRTWAQGCPAPIPTAQQLHHMD